MSICILPILFADRKRNNTFEFLKLAPFLCRFIQQEGRHHSNGAMSSFNSTGPASHTSEIVVILTITVENHVIPLFLFVEVTPGDKIWVFIPFMALGAGYSFAIPFHQTFIVEKVAAFQFDICYLQIISMSVGTFKHSVAGYLVGWADVWV